MDNFKKYTNNFTDLSKLKPEEVLYLNLCDWLELHATKINNRLHAMGGITITDPQTGIQATIKKYDLFHSLLGEMKPGSIRYHTRGGHLMIPELKAALLEIGQIKPLKRGFFDINIKAGSNKKINSCFPLGTSVDEAIEMIEKILNDALINPQLIIKSENLERLNGVCTGFTIDTSCKQTFQFYIENNIVKFFPMNPITLL